MIARVLDPGMRTTVQDLGRPGYGAMGVPPSGAADALSLRLANRVLGNRDGAAALEFTLVGPTLAFDDDAVICVSGGRVPHATVGEGAAARSVEPCVAMRITRGETLRLGAIEGSARGYLCVRGGVAVPETLGSASTLTSAGLGGYGGRPLRAGDAVSFHPSRVDDAATPEQSRKAWAWLASVLARRTLRATPALHAELFDGEAMAILTRSPFVVADRSDRVGVRLTGPAIPLPRASDAMPSEGVATGAVQIPGDGQPIVLGVDRPTTGGYPVIATVIAADLPVLGALRPRETIRFELVTRDAARAAMREQEAALDALLLLRDAQ